MTEYEFSEKQGHLLEQVGRRTMIQAILLTAVGIITVITMLVGINKTTTFSLVSGLFYGFLFVIMGMVFFRPAYNFLRAARTSGNEIRALMKGLNELNLGFDVLAILIVISVALDILNAF